ncbi:hypothetical protein FACS1894217_11750 [Clostridia bacterium]|nr:hypothetical protein FACS1894217_11750 [Clostridia bacterium]
MDKSIVGNRIRSARKDKALRLQDVAEAVGVQTSTIQRYESGKIEVLSQPILESIARCLDVDAAWLRGETDQKIAPRNNIKLDDLEFAFYGEFRELDEEDRRDLLRMAAKLRKAKSFEKRGL